MKPIVSKPSAASKFVGEAAASPEAVVKVEITGTPPAVQRAISKMAMKKGAKKGAPMPAAGGAPDDGDEKPKGFGGGRFGKRPGTDDAGDDDEAPEVKEKAVDVVEALIREKS